LSFADDDGRYAVGLFFCFELCVALQQRQVMQRRFWEPDILSAQTPTAAELRKCASQLAEGPERDQLLREADKLDRSARIEAYLRSNELKPPT
jgi:hypothetical protein